MSDDVYLVVWKRRGAIGIALAVAACATFVLWGMPLAKGAYDALERAAWPEGSVPPQAGLAIFLVLAGQWLSGSRRVARLPTIARRGLKSFVVVIGLGLLCLWWGTRAVVVWTVAAGLFWAMVSLIATAAGRILARGRQVFERSLAENPSPGTPVTFFMRRTDADSSVLRLIRGERLAANAFRVLGPVPAGEAWQFAPGSIVSCASEMVNDAQVVKVAVPLQ